MTTLNLREARMLRSLLDAHIRAQIALALAGKDVPPELESEAAAADEALQRYAQELRWPAPSASR